MTCVCILGAGHVGTALAKNLTSVGYTVFIANSRGPSTLREVAAGTGANAVAVADMPTDLDILIVAVPMGRINDLPKSWIASLSERTVFVDAGNYYPARDGAIAAIDKGLPETRWVAEQLQVPFIKAFNNIIAARLASCGKPKGSHNRIALPVAGDDDISRQRVMKIVDEIGFDPFDAGLLSESWRQQPGQPAYCTDPNANELPRLLSRADSSKGAKNRNRASSLLARLPEGYPAAELVRVSRLFVGLDLLNIRNWISALKLVISLKKGK
jgi:hypothetical protein